MGKILICGDTHYGVRSDASIFYEYFKTFNDEVLFPLIKERNIKTVVHLGDLVDRRKYINFVTSKHLREDFIDPLMALGVDLHLTLGNHDTYYKNTNDFNSIEQLFTNYPFKWYKDPTELELEGLKVLLLPWITNSNEKESYDLIANSNARVVMGHLELQGFEMNRGTLSEHGIDKKVFSRYDLVVSGHYHHKSTIDNVNYLGATYQFTWNDYEDVRGVHILDTETLELEFIENPYQLFKKIWWDDSIFTPTVDYQDYAGCFVKVVVKNKNNPYVFDAMIDGLEKIAFDVQVVEDRLYLDVEDEDIVNEAESTTSIIEKRINTLNYEEFKKQALLKLSRDVYEEALQLELISRV